MEKHDWGQKIVPPNPKCTIWFCSKCGLKRLWNGMNHTMTYGIEDKLRGYGFSKRYDHEPSCSEVHMRMVLDDG